MTRVNARELKDKLRVYLDHACKGESFQITRNGLPVAWLIPADPKLAEVQRKFRELVAEGTIRLPANPGPWSKHRPLRIKGPKLVSEMVLEDRRSRY